MFSISAITEYEVLAGADHKQKSFWLNLISRFEVLPFDRSAAQEASRIFRHLKSQNELIGVPDIFIGATALLHNHALATFNRDHFSRIKNLELYDLKALI